MSAAEPALQIRRVGPGDTPALLAFFEREGVRCACRYWHFSGDKNDWQARLAFEPGKNADELAADLATSDTSLNGVVAGRGDQIVGWMKLTPAERVTKLYAQRPYRNLACFQGSRERVYTVGCFLVGESERRQGVARALLAGGIELARAAGARAIEAFPRRGEGLRAEEQWLGPFGSFEALGFGPVSDSLPYPVLRLEL